MNMVERILVSNVKGRHLKANRDGIKSLLALFIIGFICYMIGYGHGQASAYLKSHDDKTVQSLYESKK